MGQAHPYDTQFVWPIPGMLEHTGIVIFAELFYTKKKTAWSAVFTGWLGKNAWYESGVAFYWLSLFSYTGYPQDRRYEANHSNPKDQMARP